MKGVNNMDFLKGTILGMMAGAVVAYMNTSAIDNAVRFSRRKYKKMMKRYQFITR